MSCHVLRSFLKPRKKQPSTFSVGQTMLYSFPALWCYLASFFLLQPRQRQEHNTRFRLMQAIASNTVEELLQSPPSILSLQQYNRVSCSLSFLLLRLKMYSMPFNEVSALTYSSVHSFMYDRALGCCTSSFYWEKAALLLIHNST